jgi:IclR family transcriptional regulator, KDG regulon repressor
LSESLYRVGVLEKALLLLETLAEYPDSSLADLSRYLQAPRARVFRHLKALEAAGYVSQREGTKRYVLGPRLIYLGMAARDQVRLPEIARRPMVALRDKFNETTHLGVLSHGEVVHVEVASSMHPVKMAAEVGEHTYSHCSALGKVLLAWSDPAVVEAAIEERGLPALSPRTITSPEGLRAELEQIRERGFALDDEESALGLRCVAAPVRDGTNRVVSALSLSSPAGRLSFQDALKLAPTVIETADAISRQLGWFVESAPEISYPPQDDGSDQTGATKDGRPPGRPRQA